MHRLLNARFKRDIDEDRIKGVQPNASTVPVALAVNKSSDLKESGNTFPSPNITGNRSELGVSGRHHHASLNPTNQRRAVQVVQGVPEQQRYVLENPINNITQVVHADALGKFSKYHLETLPRKYGQPVEVLGL